MILSDRCETRSCSLACVNIHKKAKGCDGKRDKVKFKRKGDMDDLDIVSDFRLLEEVGRGWISAGGTRSRGAPGKAQRS